MNTSKATINPTQSDKFSRNLSRIKLLKAAIEQSTDEARKTSLQEELDRRTAEVIPHKSALESALVLIESL